MMTYRYAIVVYVVTKFPYSSMSLASRAGCVLDGRKQRWWLGFAVGPNVLVW
jgi:hypothetical protein